MSFPSILSSFNRPSTTSRLDNPSHSALHNTVSSAVGQIEAVIGLSTSSNVGTIFYDVRSPDSGGGGHIQTANKGGTGQTSYNKGDILVATSASVLTKLAVGTEGQVLISSVAATTGVKWATLGASKIVTTASVITVIGNDNPPSGVSILSATILGSVLGTNNAIKGIAYMRDYTRFPTTSMLIRAVYAGNTVASIMIRETAAPVGSLYGTFTYTLIANAATNAQRGVLQVEFGNKTIDAAGITSVQGVLYNSNTSSVESSANQTFGITVQMPTGNMTIEGSIVEKII